MNPETAVPKINPDTAQKLYENGAIFIILNVPEGTEFGIDMKSWNTGEKFRGIKMIPPGIHFVFFSAVSESTGDVSPRTGFFHNFRTGEVLLKKWDKLNECICTNKIEEEEIVRFKENLRALDSFLGPYPYDIHEKWLNLTAHLSDELIEKFIPKTGYILSVLELESCTDANRPKISKKSQDNTSKEQPKRMRLSENSEHNFLPNLKAKEGTEMKLTEFPDKNYPEGSTPSEITMHSLDSSFVLNLMLEKYSEPMDILGELQFCYICFLVGHSLEAFEQWKKLFSLLCSCESAIQKHRRLFDAFVSLIELQIKEIPEDFLADIVTNKNFVYLKLRQLFRSIKDSNVDGILKSKSERLKQKLTEDLQWDFGHLDSEDEEDAPVIVKLKNN